jgi:anionic cell wall polymer biosynthesis LytR-Cps2A-Psr (LCP) family protein
MKKLLFTIFAIIGLAILFVAYQYRTLFTKTTTKALHKKSANTQDNLLIKKFKKQSKRISSYVMANHYNNGISKAAL